MENQNNKKPQITRPNKSKAKVVRTEGQEKESIRLNKYLSNAGYCSRRKADDLIISGVVSVNGNIIRELGTKISPKDKVSIKGKPIVSEKKVYVLLNKPKDFITTTTDTHDRKTVMDLIGNKIRERIYPVGRLDRNTTGLLLLTNDGDIARKLTHPSFEVKKVYQVTLDKALDQETFKQIEKGTILEDGFIKPDAIAYANPAKTMEEIGVEIHSGKNRIVRRIFEHYGYKVKKLDRTAFGFLSKKDLPRGRWRYLDAKEISFLKRMG